MEIISQLSGSEILIYLLGFFAQALFGARTVVQWVQSERAGRVVSPTWFWIFSLCGSSLFLVYGLIRQDVIILFGQTISFYIYIRNLQLKQVWHKLHQVLRWAIIPLPFVVMLWAWVIAPQRFQNIFTETNFASAALLLGGAGQLLLNFRYVYQWYFSEKAQQSLLPLGFWVISALASLMVVYYGIMNSEPVLLVAQGMGFVVYLRNIWFALRTRAVVAQYVTCSMTDWNRISENMVQEFIFKNEHADERELVLQHKTLFDLPTKVIAEQIAGRRKAKKKLPLWYETKGIVYPPTLNLEQSSSQATAHFKSTFLKSIINNKTITDLTGGFGVDSFFFSKQFDSVTYVEPNADLLALVRHNHTQLQAHNLHYKNTTAEEFLSSNQPTGVFYLDPARRDMHAKKIFKLSDCTPDITQLPQLFTSAEWVLLKASPLLDIQQGLRELPHTKTVIALSVENEMKELLFLSQRDFTATPEIIGVDLDSKGEIKSKFVFTQAQEATAQPVYSEPLHYLYEPGTAMLKAGAFKLIAQHFNLHKLAPHTHLYTSVVRLESFPGRAFRIEQLNPTEKQLKALLPEGRAHVAERNYPLTAQQLMKKLKLQEGGDKFVWGFSTAKRKHLAVCERIA